MIAFMEQHQLLCWSLFSMIVFLSCYLVKDFMYKRMGVEFEEQYDEKNTGSNYKNSKASRN
jgi:hypothetical protein